MIDVDKMVSVAKAGQSEDEIHRQIMLPWKDAVRIAIRNVTLRLGRAAITATGVILGIAFLVSVWTTSVIRDAIDDKGTLLDAGTTVETSVEGEVAAMENELEADTKQADSDSAREVWLVVMSLLVCGVGITNSMLMSVTERFREIGTMKCLGALDGFIVRLFLIETAVLGFLGAFAGAIIGLVVMLVVYMLKEGTSIVAKMDWGQMLVYLGIAMLIGSGISLIAAIPPAVRAAKMPAAAALATDI